MFAFIYIQEKLYEAFRYYLYISKSWLSDILIKELQQTYVCFDRILKVKSQNSSGCAAPTFTLQNHVTRCRPRVSVTCFPWDTDYLDYMFEVYITCWHVRIFLFSILHYILLEIRKFIEDWMWIIICLPMLGLCLSLWRFWMKWCKINQSRNDYATSHSTFLTCCQDF